MQLRRRQITFETVGHQKNTNRLHDVCCHLWSMIIMKMILWGRLIIFINDNIKTVMMFTFGEDA